MTTSKFTFCDLAGSERVKKTQTFSGTEVNKQAEEAKNINQSLTTLGRVILALR